MGPAAEPKGKLKTLLAAGGDKWLFRFTATTRQAVSAGAPTAPGEVLHLGGGLAGTVVVGTSCSRQQLGQSGVCDGPSGFATRDLWQQRGGGRGGWVGVPIVPCLGAWSDLAGMGPWLEWIAMWQVPCSSCLGLSPQWGPHGCPCCW